MAIELKPFPLEGQFKIYAIKTGDKCLTEEFMADQSEKMEAEAEKMLRLLEWVAKNGQPKNKEKCNTLGDKIFEFKTKKLRLGWFWDADCMIICSHGWLKKSQKTPKGEITRAIETREGYFEAKKAKQVIILPIETENETES